MKGPVLLVSHRLSLNLTYQTISANPSATCDLEYNLYGEMIKWGGVLCPNRPCVRKKNHKIIYKEKRSLNSCKLAQTTCFNIIKVNIYLNKLKVNSLSRTLNLENCFPNSGIYRKHFISIFMSMQYKFAQNAKISFPKTLSCNKERKK